MLRITKIFRFEMAHALYGYEGPCKNIHGHSYELRVTVQAKKKAQQYIDAPGFVIDFKVLKEIVKSAVLDKMDHKLFLSRSYVKTQERWMGTDNLVLFEAEPSAENLLLYISRQLQQMLPQDIELHALKLYETRDSFAEWINDAC